jgi:hypothetical protein
VPDFGGGSRRRRRRAASGARERRSRRWRRGPGEAALSASSRGRRPWWPWYQPMDSCATCQCGAQEGPGCRSARTPPSRGAHRRRRRRPPPLGSAASCELRPTLRWRAASGCLVATHRQCSVAAAAEACHRHFLIPHTAGRAMSRKRSANSEVQERPPKAATPAEVMLLLGVSGVGEAVARRSAPPRRTGRNTYVCCRRGHGCTAGRSALLRLVPHLRCALCTGCIASSGLQHVSVEVTPCRLSTWLAAAAARRAGLLAVSLSLPSGPLALVGQFLADGPGQVL